MKVLDTHNVGNFISKNLLCDSYLAKRHVEIFVDIRQHVVTSLILLSACQSHQLSPQLEDERQTEHSLILNQWLEKWMRFHEN